MKSLKVSFTAVEQSMKHILQALYIALPSQLARFRLYPADIALLDASIEVILTDCPRAC